MLIVCEIQHEHGGNEMQQREGEAMVLQSSAARLKRSEYGQKNCGSQMGRNA